MNRLKPVMDITKSMQQLLEQEITNKNRETVIEELQQKIEERGHLLQTLTEPYNEEEESLGTEIVQLNQQIETKMNKLFHHLKMEMKQIKKKKRSNNSYINPYQHVQSSDGIFMDNKK